MPHPIFRKFVNLSNQKRVPPPLDGELLYSKNAVCVHPPGSQSSSVLHHSGFLAITAKVQNEDVSLILNWSPNSNIAPVNHEKCEAVANSSNVSESSASDKISNTTEKAQLTQNANANISDLKVLKIESEVLNKANHESASGEQSEEDYHIFASNHQQSHQAAHDVDSLNDSVHIKKNNSSCQGSNFKSMHQAFGPFTINLGVMRSIRIYFRNEHHTSGEIIIASTDCQYNILHFHSGGLDFVASILNQWKVSLSKKNLSKSGINHFSIIYPNLSTDQLHPEEGLYRKLTTDTWQLLADEFGRIQNELNIQKAVFFGGIEKVLQPVVWPFFLKLYHFTSTEIERNELLENKLCKYQRINNEREEIFSDGISKNYWKNIACCIEKDVLRTDRTNPFFKGEGNPNLDTLHRILLNYAVYTKTSYTQGMSDLLSPLLVKIRTESDVFWCFVGLMQQTIFISSPTDVEMEKQLFFLRELLRILLPSFYSHMMACDPGAKELLFAHRWILLCFKREFFESDALVIWEACWARYQTNYFHLFVCVAIISLYGRDVAEMNLAADEMLLHFSHLALQMNRDLVMKKARGLLHQVRTLPAIPCTLHDLFSVDADASLQHMPLIVCAKTPYCMDGCPHQRPSKASQSPRFNIRKLLS